MLFTSILRSSSPNLNKSTFLYAMPDTVGVESWIHASLFCLSGETIEHGVLMLFWAKKQIHDWTFQLKYTNVCSLNKISECISIHQHDISYGTWFLDSFISLNKIQQEIIIINLIIATLIYKISFCAPLRKKYEISIKILHYDVFNACLKCWSENEQYINNKDFIIDKPTKHHVTTRYSILEVLAIPLLGLQFTFRQL
jgi:hypothetical protein